MLVGVLIEHYLCGFRTLARLNDTMQPYCGSNHCELQPSMGNFTRACSVLSKNTIRSPRILETRYTGIVVPARNPDMQDCLITNLVITFSVQLFGAATSAGLALNFSEAHSKISNIQT